MRKIESKQIFKEYCTGCGLCESVLGVETEKDPKGFVFPEVDSEKMEFFQNVCPAGGTALKNRFSEQIWGNAEEIFLGWSADEGIRKQASSGGILTSICVYLLENGIVDGIIQTTVDEEAVYRTKTVVSRTREEVLRCTGSRYAISSPLKNITQLVQENETYAFVGKPCDVSALAMYLEWDQKLKTQISYLFSFFCAGVPSETANKKLLKELGCENSEECVFLQYRGNGWPGNALAKKTDGTEQQMTYEESWGKILGRDVRKSCRFCIDGIGEMADIACGDAWYLTEDKLPSFSDQEGRNVIFARTLQGALLLKAAEQQGYLKLQDYKKQVDDLRYIQKYQFERRATMGSMLRALRLFGKPIPNYGKSEMKKYGVYVSAGKRLRRFVGACKRVLQKKI